MPLLDFSERHIECCVNPLESAREPKAEFRLQFAQFVDGSTFGDPAEALVVVAARASALNAMRKLLHTYIDRGDQEFVRSLGERLHPDEVGGIFVGIRRVQREKGTGAAVAQLRSILALAEERETMLRKASSQ